MNFSRGYTEDTKISAAPATSMYGGSGDNAYVDRRAGKARVNGKWISRDSKEYGKYYNVVYKRSGVTDTWRESVYHKIHGGIYEDVFLRA